MAVHVPLSPEADGRPVITPTQDIVLGNYYLTIEQRNVLGEGMLFASQNEALIAFQNGAVHVHALVGISTKAYPLKSFTSPGVIVTTIGKILLNSVLPVTMNYINAPSEIGGNGPTTIVKHGESIKTAIENRTLAIPFAKKHLSLIVEHLYKNFALHDVPRTMDLVKNLGFEFATRSGITVSAFDVPTYDRKYEYFTVADASVERLTGQFNKGLLTNDERYSRVVRI
ncbi:unnamed protein product [Didymodactylos carnosus]|uniref:DNA-directed RNA polymerase n=1 Tax=Didymodactylos carnosus TaxID=1234261 RepID=A0A8S2CQZ2_9BILA|nr:unnamed protein product [Didymodactylos carnosus]CAF3492202.1 unnamed protein product [Didymodactylos carnosus]